MDEQIMSDDQKWRVMTMENDRMQLSYEDAEIFENVRQSLYDLSFCLLHSELQAERAVRRTLIHWLHADRRTISYPPTWLSANCLLQAIEILRWTQRRSDSSLDEKLGAAMGHLSHSNLCSKNPATGRGWMSRFAQNPLIKSLFAAFVEGFAISGASLHPMIILHANDFKNQQNKFPMPQDTIEKPRE